MEKLATLKPAFKENGTVTAANSSGINDGAAACLLASEETVKKMGVNPMAIALASDATYVARAFAGDLKHMKDMIEGGIKHKGFALIDIFQPCTTYNHDNTFDWFKEVTYKLEDDGHDPRDKQAAFKRAMEHDKLPIGLFFREEKLTYEDEVVQIKKKPLVEHDISNIDIDDIMDELM